MDVLAIILALGVLIFMIWACHLLQQLNKRTSDVSDIYIHVRALGGALQTFGNQIKEKLNKIMATQEEFDAKIDAANTALDAIGEAITAESKQIADFIASLPKDIDTSKLDGVVTRLDGVAASVGSVFEPPTA